MQLFRTGLFIYEKLTPLYIQISLAISDADSGALGTTSFKTGWDL